MKGRKASPEALDSGSDDESKHLKTGEAYQLLLNTLSAGKEVTARPAKRQKTAARLGGVAKQTNVQLQTTARSQVRLLLAVLGAA